MLDFKGKQTPFPILPDPTGEMLLLASDHQEMAYLKQTHCWREVQRAAEFVRLLAFPI